MNAYQIFFSHPLSGKVFLTNARKESVFFRLNTDENGILNIPVSGLAKGIWHAVCEWEYEDRTFDYSCDIDVR